MVKIFDKNSVISEDIFKCYFEQINDFSDAVLDYSTANSAVLRLDIWCELAVDAQDRTFEKVSRSETIKVSPATQTEYLASEIEHWYDFLTDPTNGTYENEEKSGLSFNGGTGVIFLSIAKYGEAVVQNENDDPPIEDDDDEPRPPATREQKIKNNIASRFLLWVLYMASKGMKTPGSAKTRNTWMRNHHVDYDVEIGNYSPVNIYDLQALFPNIFVNWIRWIFVDTYGCCFNVINPHGLKTRFIEFDGQTNMWRFVYNPYHRYKISKNMRFCTLCYAHHVPQVCNRKNGTWTVGEGYKRIEHDGINQLVVYGDWEAIITPEGEHMPCMLGFTNTRCRDVHIIQHNEPATSMSWAKSVFDYLLLVLRRWNIKSRHELYGKRLKLECGHESDEAYVGVAPQTGRKHQACKHCWQKINAITILFHNASNYDNAFNLHVLNNLKELTNNAFLPQIMGKSVNKHDQYVSSFYNYKIVIRDSAKHLQGSLQSFAEKLKDKDLSAHAVNGKGIFPYEWLDSYEKLEDRWLPNEGDAWFNKLTGTMMDEKQAFHDFVSEACTSVREYMVKYLTKDVQILHDIFNDYRRKFLQRWNADPANFYGLPSLGFYCCRKQQGENEYKWNSTCNIILPGAETNKAVYSTYWYNIRGGITNSLCRYKKAEDGEILYFDVNSLYATAMLRGKQPIGETMQYYDWKGTVPEFIEKIKNYPDHVSCHAWVDISFPNELHDDMPLPLCERKRDGGLLNAFYDIDMQLHSVERILQMLEHGLKIDKVHCYIEFERAAKYKDYIQSCLDMRAECIANGDESGSTTAKLASNAVYGKTMENPTKYTEILLSDNAEAVCNFTSVRHISDSYFVASRPTKQVETIKTPWDGFTILEDSKVIFYNGVKEFLSVQGVELLYCDTDSLILYSPTKIYESLKNDILPDLISETKEFGKWQLEYPPDTITEFISTASKCYYLDFKDGGHTKRHKGVRKNADVTRADYLAAVMANKRVSKTQTQLVIDSATVKTSQIEKIALSPKNNKRIILEDGFTTVAFGYRGNRYGGIQEAGYFNTDDLIDDEQLE